MSRQKRRNRGRRAWRKRRAGGSGSVGAGTVVGAHASKGRLRGLGGAMKSLRICACALTGLLLTSVAAGCASAEGTVHPATGHLAGKLVMEGGPLGPGGQQPGERPMSGTVTFTAAG